MITPSNAAHVADLLHKKAAQIFGDSEIGGLMVWGAGIIRDQLTELDSTRAQCATDTRIANEVESLLNDLDIGSVADLRKHITDLTAKVEAARNPPYTLHIEPERFLGEVTYAWIVKCGTSIIWRQGDYRADYEARAEGGAFLKRLTAPFQPKES